MKILILGGAGMIGQAIAKKHISQGDDVYIYDTAVNPFNDYTSLFGTIVDDINGDYDLISNQAALVGVGESMYKPHYYIQNNTDIVARLIQNQIDSGIYTPIIHAGSMGPYGEGPRYCTYCDRTFYVNRIRTTLDIYCPHCGRTSTSCRIWEDTPLKPQSYYGLTKLMQEESLRIFSQAYNVPVTSLRYFSVYDTKQNPTNPKTGVLTVIANQIVNRDCITINEDGHQTRDLIHASDVAEVHYRASRNMACGFNVYNVGTGHTITMQYIAERMRDYINPSMPIEYTGNVRIGDIKNSCAGITRIRNILGMESFIDIETAITEYSEYVMQNWDSFRADTWELENAKLKAKGLQ